MPNYNKYKQSLIEEIKKGEITCCLCNEKAQYVIERSVNKNKFYDVCCSESIKECTEYSNYKSNLYKQLFKDNPEYIENLKIAQNSSKTKEKKSNSMKKLHRTDKNFQKNYELGRDKFRKILEEHVKNKTHWSGTGDGYAIKHHRCYKYKKSACQLCGCTRQLSQHIYGIDLHIHNISGDCNINNKDFWMTLCLICHGLVHKNMRNGYKS